MREEREIFARGRARVEACCLFSGISSVSNTETEHASKRNYAEPI